MNDRWTAHEIIDADRHCLWHPFTQMRDWEQSEPLVIESARGAVLRDINGIEYIDGVSSLWANIHGHRHPTIDRYVMEQLGRVAHSTLLGLAGVPSAQLAKRLVDITPDGLTRVFFSDNGSTATEIAIKMAYQYWQQRRPEPRPKKTRLASFTNAYHGDTLGAVGAGGIDLFHAVYQPLITPAVRSYHPYCYRCEYGREWPSCDMYCVESIKRTLERHGDELFAVIIEPLVQGAGGMITAPPGFLREVRRLTREHDVLLICDEVATGFGRTGKMFACEHEDVVPDIMALGKGLTGGYLPAAATVVTEEIYSAFLGDYTEQRTFFHGHTYTGNALACAAGLGSLDVFEKEHT
ncbi:MAG: adenosylmethionine--8-amino-7-oxononanoate transaminase, partial [Candidatus Hydrogenedentes bacterium]|nr:adenosylmethionine--8-amino-7-oxononanoate transaminase [Candidatus Hydrogenedentota bacterium]